MNIFKREQNIAKYKSYIELSERDEKFAKYCEVLKEHIGNSAYFINMGDNNFNGIGYFYFDRQRKSKKDLIYITFKDFGDYYKIGLSAKMKKLDITELDTLCEVFLSDNEIDNAVENFTGMIKTMLKECGIEYEIARIKEEE
ncbi:hypothetical protein HpBT060_15040 [Helicobacter pylori]